jgi:hypothetical protein
MIIRQRIYYYNNFENQKGIYILSSSGRFSNSGTHPGPHRILLGIPPVQNDLREGGGVQVWNGERAMQACNNNKINQGARWWETRRSTKGPGSQSDLSSFEVKRSFLTAVSEDGALESQGIARRLDRMEKEIRIFE